MQYYHNTLLNDYAELNGKSGEVIPEIKKQYTYDEVVDYVTKANIFHYGCLEFCKRELALSDNLCDVKGFRPSGLGSSICGKEKCLQEFYKYIIEEDITLEDITLEDDTTESTIENTCVKRNIIDIYKFASSFITSAMRELHNGNDKPFIHVEVTTKGFPKILKIR